MVQASTGSLTLEAFLQMPETKPASEFINGNSIQKPMPQGEHSAIQTELAAAINQILRPQKIARAFSELRCTFGGRSTIPDISVFQWARIPRQSNGRVANHVLIAPDWTIEILSPDQSQTQVTKNILHCLQHGTQLGWLIDPGEQSVLAYFPHQTTMICDQAENQLPVPEFAQEVKLTVEHLFSWLID